MPWKESSRMSARLEFVRLALVAGANKVELCRRFNISPKTGYKWLDRYKELGETGLVDQSRRPQHSPTRCDDALERKVLALHDTYPCWGARKLHALLPEGRRPHPSTIDAILRRHGRQIQGDERGPRAVKRFEHPAPNLLWQMDFKGHFALTDRHARRCHALTVLDDHSRFALCLAACGDETRVTVQTRLVEAFRRYGLPERITTDNGPPWGARQGEGISGLEAWLIRLGVRVSHSRPYHPQTQGKDERFHRTLKRELLNSNGFHSLQTCQAAFDSWRHRYNLVRPHEALGQRPPISRYEPSGRGYPEQLPPIEYDPADRVLKVRTKGQVHIGAKHVFIGEGLAGEQVAIRATETDGMLAIYYCHRLVRKIDLRATS
jgi:transposase InsO family protein